MLGKVDHFIYHSIFDFIYAERANLIEQCESLRTELEEAYSRTDRRSLEQLQMEAERGDQLQVKVRSLEEGLKEAITRCAVLQEAAEKSEQDLYKLKLKHQLEIREIQRTPLYTPSSNGAGVVTPPLPASPPKPPQQVYITLSGI